jgi:hypothetical protein
MGVRSLLASHYTHKLGKFRILTDFKEILLLGANFTEVTSFMLVSTWQYQTAFSDLPPFY